MAQQTSIQEQLIAKAMKDETFRQELLSNPKVAIERTLGISIPAGVTIAVHQDTPTTFHLVLPVKATSPAWTELSDAELEQATGGATGGYCYNRYSSWGFGFGGQWHTA